MAFAQWSTLRRASGLRVRQAGASFAMIPTLTPVSRQAIFAGALPSTFPETIRRTSSDERRWRDFWLEEGQDVGAVRYTRLSGAFPSDVPDLGDTRVFGMVVGAIDEVMPGRTSSGMRR
jgi:PglZ domain